MMKVSSFTAALLFCGTAVYGQDAVAGPGRWQAVFLATNDADRNEVISFVRSADGTLQEGRRFAACGRCSAGTHR